MAAAEHHNAGIFHVTGVIVWWLQAQSELLQYTQLGDGFHSIVQEYADTMVRLHTPACCAEMQRLASWCNKGSPHDRRRVSEHVA